MDSKRNLRVVNRLKCVLAAVLLGLLSSAARPAVTSQSIAANESAAIAILRTIAKAQRLVTAAVEIDTDGDGIGEYGYLAELSGAQPLRVSALGVPAAGVAGIDNLAPPLLRDRLGKVRYSVVVHSGYVFQVWLAGPMVGGLVGGYAEDLKGGKNAGPFPDPITGAKYWCCYAWPLAYNVTGRRAFVVNQRDTVLEYANRSPWSFSSVNWPSFDEAFEILSDMSCALRVGTPGGHLGSTWWPAQ
jgi:hypothetical protein